LAQKLNCLILFTSQVNQGVAFVDSKHNMYTKETVTMNINVRKSGQEVKSGSQIWHLYM